MQTHMSAALGQPIARQLTQTSRYLRAEFGFGNATEIAELYRALAVTCVEKQVTRVLIIAGDDEPAGERALRDALTTMILAGISEDFRLALVTALPRVAHAYRNTQRDLNAAGVATRVFENEEDAVRWLDGAPPAA
jgi:hypothetical protein